MLGESLNEYFGTSWVLNVCNLMGGNFGRERSAPPLRDLKAKHPIKEIYILGCNEGITYSVYENYKNSVKEDFWLSIKPIWKMIKDIEEYYKADLEIGRPGSCHPFSDEALSWHRTSISKSTSLNAAGLSLIHVGDTFLKKIITDHKITFGLSYKSCLENWAESIVAGSNFCRHGDSWFEQVESMIKAEFSCPSDKGRVSYSNDDLDKKIIPLIKGPAAANIETLLKNKILSISLITPTPDYFDLAKSLSLTSEKKLGVAFDRFLDHLTKMASESNFLRKDENNNEEEEEEV